MTVENTVNYKIELALLKSLLAKSVIDASEFSKAENKLKKLYK